jgi:hypothetical protein
MGEEIEAPVRLTKQPAADGAGSADSAGGARVKVAVPRSIDLVVAAIAAQIVCCLVRALSLRGFTGELTQWLIDSNKDAKKPKNPYTAADIAHDLSQLRSGALMQGIVISVLLALLAAMMRRQSGGAGAARWGVIAVIILTSGPFYVMPVSGWPAVPKVAGVLMGVSSIAAIVLLLVPSSMKYFRDVREANRPAGAATAGQAGRPGGMGLGSLFAPRPRGGGGLFAPRIPQANGTARESKATGASAPSDATAPSDSAAARTRSKPKAKLRTDEAAIARGASIARNRAKAAKSRRTEV